MIILFKNSNLTYSYLYLKFNCVNQTYTHKLSSNLIQSNDSKDICVYIRINYYKV